MSTFKEPGFTLSIRLIRSFEYRNIKTIVLHDVPSHLLVKELTERIVCEIQKSQSLPPPFKRHQYGAYIRGELIKGGRNTARSALFADCLKIHSQAHGAKTNNIAINLDHDELILNPDSTLTESNIRNETEISFFVREEYEKYKSNPQLLW